MPSRNLALPLILSETPTLPEVANAPVEEKNSALWLCIHLPNMPLEILNLKNVENPQCVLTEVAGRWLIHTPCELAADRGVASGMALNAAYALCPDLQVYRRTLLQEKQQLKQLADWAYQFSSMVSIVEPQSLLLEIQGSLQLFGGLSALLKKIEESLLTKWQYTLQMAVTPTPLASRLFAQIGKSIIVEQSSGLRSALGDLSINTLLLDDHKTVKKLAKIGVSTLQDLWRLPRDGLARRFGQALINHLDKLLGDKPDLQHLHELPLIFDASVELPMEAANHKSVLIAAEKILQGLEKYLRNHDAGLTQLFVRLYHYDHPPQNLSVGFRQTTRCAEHIQSLFQERLDNLKLMAPVTEVRLMVKEIIPFVTCSDALFASQTLPVVDLLPANAKQLSDPDWESTLEQLQNRLGQQAVLQLQVVDDHRPEHAWAYGEPLPCGTQDKAELRPTWILPKAKHLIVRNGTPWLRGPLCFLQGPERIESGWWQGDDVCRDYYIARDGDSSRVWIYRDLKQRDCWYLQGYFG